LLAATGRWHDAEAELAAAIRTFDVGHRALGVHATIKLADLRIQQGRLEEAETLLAGFEDHGAAMVPLARLHLARGEPQLARAVLEHALGADAAPTLGQAPLLLLLVEAQLATGDAAAARAQVDQLAALAEQARSDLLWAQVELATGQVMERTDAPDAARHFQAALARLRSYEQSLLAGRARFELARLNAETDRAGAITWARAARATFERIGATHDADAVAELLRHLGAPTRAAPRLAGPLTKREEEVLSLLRRGLTNREIGDRLFISAKTTEHHVSQILGKLGVRSRAEAIAYATRVTAGEADATIGRGN
jgi:ATP/maltotriose-dependent transcriptional regulator MalT